MRVGFHEGIGLGLALVGVLELSRDAVVQVVVAVCADARHELHAANHIVVVIRHAWEVVGTRMAFGLRHIGAMGAAAAQVVIGNRGHRGLSVLVDAAELAHLGELVEIAAAAAGRAGHKEGLALAIWCPHIKAQVLALGFAVEFDLLRAGLFQQRQHFLDALAHITPLSAMFMVHSLVRCSM